jgi:hypothetical protein
MIARGHWCRGNSAPSCSLTESASPALAPKHLLPTAKAAPRRNASEACLRPSDICRGVSAEISPHQTREGLEPVHAPSTQHCGWRNPSERRKPCSSLDFPSHTDSMENRGGPAVWTIHLSTNSTSLQPPQGEGTLRHSPVPLGFQGSKGGSTAWRFSRWQPKHSASGEGKPSLPHSPRFLKESACPRRLTG